MDWSEEDQKVAVSAASAMSLKRSISSLDLAPDARAARARRSAQPSNKEGLEDPTLETPLKDTGLPPSPPTPPIDGRTLSDLEVLRTIETIKYDLGMDSLGMDTLAQLLADKTTTDKGFNDLGPVALPRIGKEERKEALEEFRKGKGKSGGARGEGASDKRAVALEARERLGLPPAKGWKKYDTTYWEQEGCRLAHRLASRLASRLNSRLAIRLAGEYLPQAAAPRGGALSERSRIAAQLGSHGLAGAAVLEHREHDPAAARLGALEQLAGERLLEPLGETIVPLRQAFEQSPAHRVRSDLRRGGSEGAEHAVEHAVLCGIG